MAAWAIAFWFVALAAGVYLLVRGGASLRHPRWVLAWGVVGFLALVAYATHQLVVGVGGTTTHERGLIGQAVLLYAFSLFFLGGVIAAGRFIRKNPSEGTKSSD